MGPEGNLKTTGYILNTNKAARSVLIMLLLAFAYIIGSRAINTGSLQQYGLLILAGVIAAKLFVDGFAPKKNGKKH